MKLKDLNKQIPGGLVYYIPVLKWRSQPWDSFDVIVANALSAMQANAHLAKSQGWTLTHEWVAAQVENFNAQWCAKNGWNDYVMADGGPSFPAPFRQPGLLQSLKRSVVGVRTIADMFGSEGPTTADVAEKRAAVCATCPLNDKGDWTRFFTVPASNSIREALSVFEGTKLTTSFDSELKICTGCGCPCKLKVFARIDHILRHMPSETKAALDPRCWVLSEDNSKT